MSAELNSDTDFPLLTSWDGTERIPLSQGGVPKHFTPYMLGREVLLAARTYYVRTDGSNLNTGLADTAAGAFLTIQKAVDTVLRLNLNGQAVTIQIRDGTYNEAVTAVGSLTGGGSLTITGNTVTPANCVIAPTTGSALGFSQGFNVTIGGLKFVSADAGGLVIDSGSRCIISGACEFGACATIQISVGTSCFVHRQVACTITGAAASHLSTARGAHYTGSGTVTITGTPAFSDAFLTMSRGSSVFEGSATAYSGATTGFKYKIDSDCSLRGTTTVVNMNDVLPGDKLGVIRPLETTKYPYRNLLYNASGRLREGSSGAIGDDTYGLHNRWYILSQSGNVTPSALNNVADGVPSLMRLTNSHGSSQRMAYAQILPGYAARALRGKRLWLSSTMRLSANNTSGVRLSVLSWSGTEDVLASDVVNDWTSTTYTVGNFYTNPAGLSVLFSAVTTLVAVDTLYNKTASTWSIDVPSDCNNLIIMLHTSSAIATSATFDLRVQLEEGSTSSPFDVRPLELERQMCAPFYQAKTVRSQIGDRHIPLLKMRSTPTVTVGVGTAANITVDGFELNHAAAADCTVTASAEL